MFCEEHLYREGTVCWYIDLVKNSRPWIWFKHPTDVDYFLKKKKNLDLEFAFFFCGDAGLFQCMGCFLVSGSYWKILSFITSNNISEEGWIILYVFQDVSSNSQPIFFLLRSEFWYHLCTYFSHAKQFLYPNLIFHLLFKCSGYKLLNQF